MNAYVWYRNGLDTVTMARRWLLLDVSMGPLEWAEGFRLVNKIEMYLLRQLLAAKNCDG